MSSVNAGRVLSHIPPRQAPTRAPPTFSLALYCHPPIASMPSFQNPNPHFAQCSPLQAAAGAAGDTAGDRGLPQPRAGGPGGDLISRGRRHALLHTGHVCESAHRHVRQPRRRRLRGRGDRRLQRPRPLRRCHRAVRYFMSPENILQAQGWDPGLGLVIPVGCRFLVLGRKSCLGMGLMASR